MTRKPLTIYHNPRCSKSRAALELLQESGATYSVVEYLISPPDEAALERLLEQLGKEPHEIARKGEDRYRELKLAERGPGMSRKEWIKILCANPILIERPIVTDGKRAVIGRPPESVAVLLK